MIDNILITATLCFETNPLIFHKIFFLESQYKSTLENKTEMRETDLTASITIIK